MKDKSYHYEKMIYRLGKKLDQQQLHDLEVELNDNYTSPLCDIGNFLGCNALERVFWDDWYE